MKKIKCVVPISGGKDSQACLKLAVEHFGREHVIGLFCDTKFEHPITYQHVDKIGEMYGVEIFKRSDSDVLSECRKNKRFPSDIARFCTNKLKIRLTKNFLKAVAEDQKQGFEVWYGMRKAESHHRAKRYEGKFSDELYAPKMILEAYPKYLEKMGVMFRMPICEWTTQEVFNYLEGKENPLYAYGFDRVGCFPCLAGGDKYKDLAFNLDDFGREQRKRVREVENELGKSVFTSKKGLARDQSTQERLCFICQI